MSIDDVKAGEWLVVLAYLVCGVRCLLTAKAERRCGHQDARTLWQAVGVTALLLALLKVFGFQTIVIKGLRLVFRDHGWYSDRRELQGWAIYFVVAAAVVGLTLIWLKRDSLVRLSATSSVRSGATASIVLLMFVAVRAISLHDVDTFLYRLPVVGEYMSIGIELLLILILAWVSHRAAAAARRHLKRSAIPTRAGR
jgi:hypothetical protein